MLAGKNNEEKIWNYLKSAGLNDFGTAGLMGNLYAESGLIPNNVENLYEKRLGVTDASYTAAVDSGKYQFFATDKAGYGLAQWTYCSRKAELLDYAQCCRKSIGDLEMQLDFLMKELREGYKAVLAVLKTAGSVRAASDAVLLKFERPADQSEAAQARRAAFGQKYYDKYAAGSAAGSGGKPMTEQEQRQKIVSIAQSYIGCKESDGSHRKIIDLYNSHKPLARGYAVKYTDAWCSTFASAVAIAAGMTDIIPTECGCGKHIELFKKLGSWQEDDAYVPKPGDYIFYDWPERSRETRTTGRNSRLRRTEVRRKGGDRRRDCDGRCTDQGRRVQGGRHRDIHRREALHQRKQHRGQTVQAGQGQGDAGVSAACEQASVSPCRRERRRKHRVRLGGRGGHQDRSGGAGRGRSGDDGQGCHSLRHHAQILLVGVQRKAVCPGNQRRPHFSFHAEKRRNHRKRGQEISDESVRRYTP
jgi:hypothetical protein